MARRRTNISFTIAPFRCLAFLLSEYIFFLIQFGIFANDKLRVTNKVELGALPAAESLLRTIPEWKKKTNEILCAHLGFWVRANTLDQTFYTHTEKKCFEQFFYSCFACFSLNIMCMCLCANKTHHNQAFFFLFFERFLLN